MKPPTIVTDHFTLRPYRLSDRDALVRAINDPLVARYTSAPFPYRLKDAVLWIQKTKLEARKKNGNIDFALDRNGEVVGGISFKLIHPRHKAEVGYWLTKRLRGQGIMPRAVRLVVEYGFRRLRLRRIYAFTISFNRSSVRVLQKCGFRREGILRKHLKRGDRYFDNYLFARVK